MDDYKFQQRRKKRGDNCIFSYIDKAGVGRSCLCGCGARTPPAKKYKTRIVKRALKRQEKLIIDELIKNQD